MNFRFISSLFSSNKLLLEGKVSFIVLIFILFYHSINIYLKTKKIIWTIKHQDRAASFVKINIFVFQFEGKIYVLLFDYYYITQNNFFIVFYFFLLFFCFIRKTISPFNITPRGNKSCYQWISFQQNNRKNFPKKKMLLTSWNRGDWMSLRYQNFHRSFVALNLILKSTSTSLPTDIEMLKKEQAKKHKNYCCINYQFFIVTIQRRYSVFSIQKQDINGNIFIFFPLLLFQSAEKFSSFLQFSLIYCSEFYFCMNFKFEGYGKTALGKHKLSLSKSNFSRNSILVSIWRRSQLVNSSVIQKPCL